MHGDRDDRDVQDAAVIHDLNGAIELARSAMCAVKQESELHVLGRIPREHHARGRVIVPSNRVAFLVHPRSFGNEFSALHFEAIVIFF